MEAFAKRWELEPVRARLRSWWRQLASCLAPGDRAGGPRALTLAGDGSVALGPDRYPSVDVFLDAGLDAGLRREGVSLRLPARALLATRLELPLAAGANLPEVLRYEMDRYTPFSAEQVYFDQRVLGRDPERGRLDVELALVRRALVDPVLQACAARGLPVREIQGEGLWEGADLMPPALRSRRRGAGASLRLALAGLAVVLALTALLTPLWQDRRGVVALGEELDALRVRAGELVALRERLAERRALAGAVLEHAGERPPMVDVLRELSRVLPDDTWLQSLEIRGDALDMQGESGRATDLIALLEDSPLFEGVSFRSPLVQVRGEEKERFAIGMRLAGEEA